MSVFGLARQAQRPSFCFYSALSKSIINFMAAYSIIIRNGLVFDGQNRPGRKADLAIDGDRIAALGDLSRDTAALEIDAANLYVSPGFIDLTNHSDTHWTLFNEPNQTSLILQGVTTVLGGNCGSSLAPLVKAEDIGAIQKWVDVSKINVNWQSIAEFFKELSRHKFAVNFATLVGHGTLRRASGTDISRPAAEDEVKKMSYLLYQAMSAGAFGLSTSLGRSHELSATDDEMLELMAQVKVFDGLAAHHLEDEGSRAVSAVSRIIGLSRGSGVRGHISHFKILGRKSWPNQKTALDIIKTARRDGVKLTLDVFPYTATGSNLYLLLPEWAREGGKERIVARLKDKKQRKEVKNELRRLTLHYEKIMIASTLKDNLSVGKNISVLAEGSGLDPEEMIIELLITNGLNVSIFNEAISEENLFAAAAEPYAAISSDGVGQGLGGPSTDLPHPRSFGAFSRALKIFVKEKNILSWEEAIYKMTGLAAEILGLEKRGELREDFFADIAVFDPEAVGDNADYLTPRRFSQGIKWLFVNGEAVISEGEWTGRLTGRILKKT